MRIRLDGRRQIATLAFYGQVGTVDFCQSLEQLVMWQERDDGPPTDEVLYAGEYDPLVVGLLDPEPYDAQLCFFAPDEFHRANYSGGENNHVRLPVAGADFRIAGMYDIRIRRRGSAGACQSRSADASY